MQQTGTNKLHPKFIEIQKQMQCLIIEIKHLKTCNTSSKQNDNESTEIAQQNPEIAPLLLQPPLNTNFIWNMIQQPIKYLNYPFKNTVYQEKHLHIMNLS